MSDRSPIGLTLAGWARGAVDLLLPPGCVCCGAWIPGGAALVCPLCRTRLREPPWPRCPRCHAPLGTARAPGRVCFECAAWPGALTAARAAYALEGPAERLVHALKYGGWRELAPAMADAMAGLVGPPAAGATPGVAPGRTSARRIAVPVPTTVRRARDRGYDQAALLAEHLCRAGGIERCEALRRTGAARSQTTLRPDERAENVRDAFAVVPGAGRSVRGADVLLVDDVLTTGATAGAAATALAPLGPRSVTLVAFARAIPRRP